MISNGVVGITGPDFPFDVWVNTCAPKHFDDWPLNKQVNIRRAAIGAQSIDDIRFWLSHSGHYSLGDSI
jgi:hypothetical protein